MKKINLIGKRFGRLVVLSSADKMHKKTAWNCLCDCGNYTITTSDSLKSGKTQSCGCLAKERAREANIKHGKIQTPLYKIFASMKQRCYNKNQLKYKIYGARGIKICDEWLKNFNNFYDWAIENGYNKSLSIDRIDNNGNYEPSNCRWVNAKAQALNRRNNVVISYNGETHPLSIWCEKLNLPYERMEQRIKSGWDAKKAFTTPILSNIERRKTFEYNGTNITYYDLCNITGINYKTIKNRILKGWSIERVINTPLSVNKNK